MSFGTAGNGYPDPRSELSALIEAADLGHPIDDRVLDALVDMQATLHARQEELAQMLLVKKISRNEYVSNLDGIMREAARVGEHLLGFDDFHKVFGEFRVHNMVDVKTFVAGGGAAAR